MNILIRLAYDGTAYHGWQKQENAVTVQETLHNSLLNVMNDIAEIQGVSRTDAGVHALDYIANFTTNSTIPLERIPQAVNSFLPKDIRVYSATKAEDSFNSRFNAVSKTYIYRMYIGKIQPPFERNYSWHVPYSLDIEKMRNQIEMLIGTHDFSAFCASGEQRENRIRTINFARIKQTEEVIEIEINANGFLYNMMRIISGTLADIASGKKMSEINEILESEDRNTAGITAPPHGLFLKNVIIE